MKEYKKPLIKGGEAIDPRGGFCNGHTCNGR